MKTKKSRAGRHLITTALATVIIVVFSGCQTIDSIETPDEAGRWKYRVQVTKPDTEEEGRRAILLYRGRELPGYFSTVVVGDSKYDYTIRIEPSDFSGYRKDPEYIQPAPSANRMLEQEELKRGWHFAPADQRPGNTPRNWIWVRRENLEAFVDPDKLYRFINKYELVPEADEPEPAFRFKFSYGVSF